MPRKSVVIFSIALIVLIGIGIFVVENNFRKNRMEANVVRCTELGMKRSQQEKVENNNEKVLFTVNLGTEYRYSKKLNTCLYKTESQSLGMQTGEIVDLYTNERIAGYNTFTDSSKNSDAEVRGQLNFYSEWTNSFKE